MVERDNQFDPSIPNKETETFEPRFSFTKDIMQKFEEKGISNDKYLPLIKEFDNYLKLSAEAEGLIAIGIVAVPGDQGSAGYIVAEDGVVLDAATYWSFPKKEVVWPNQNRTVYKNGEDFASIDSSNGNKATVFWADSVSIEVYPTLADFKGVLEDPEARKDFTASGAFDANFDCEFWGMVTTEELRQELNK